MIAIHRFHFWCGFLAVTLLGLSIVISHYFLPRISDTEMNERSTFYATSNTHQYNPRSTTFVTTNNKDTGNHLDFIVVGIAQSTDESSVRAIIVSGGKQNIYAKGASLPGYKVSLKEIAADHVIIDNNGHAELLRLSSPGDTVFSPAPLDTANEPKDTPDFYGGPGYDDAVTFPPAERDEEMSLAEINRNLEDLVALSIYRMDSNRQLRGYKILPGFDVEKFRNSGLQAGDLVTAINGIPVTKPNDILASYKTTTETRLEIERGDEVIEVGVNKPM